MTEASREDLIEEFLATSGKYPGLAEFLDDQRDAERSADHLPEARLAPRRRASSRAEAAQS